MDWKTRATLWIAALALGAYFATTFLNCALDPACERRCAQAGVNTPNSNCVYSTTDPKPIILDKEHGPTEAASLFVRMQCALLCFLLLDQFMDAFGGARIIYVSRERSVVIDLLVDLDALLAHELTPLTHNSVSRVLFLRNAG